MTRSRLSVCATSFLAASVAFLSACGSDGDGGPSFSDSVSTADAQAFATAAVARIGLATGQLNFGTGNLDFAPAALGAPRSSSGAMGKGPFGARVDEFLGHHLDVKGFLASRRVDRAAPLENCTTTESGTSLFGDVLDEDNDGIPDDYHYRQVCTATDSTSAPDTTVVSNRLTELRIKQNVASLHGYDASLVETGRATDQYGNFQAAFARGAESLDIRADHAAHGWSYAYGESMKYGAASAADEHGTSWATEFAPSETIPSDGPLPNGALTVSGRLYATDTEGTNLSFTVATTTPLAYSAACDLAATNPPFTAGAIRGLLNNRADRASFTVTFTSCGNKTVTIDGAHDPSAVAAR